MPNFKRPPKLYKTIDQILEQTTNPETPDRWKVLWTALDNWMKVWGDVESDELQKLEKRIVSAQSKDQWNEATQKRILQGNDSAYLATLIQIRLDMYNVNTKLNSLLKNSEIRTDVQKKIKSYTSRISTMEKKFLDTLQKFLTVDETTEEEEKYKSQQNSVTSEPVVCRNPDIDDDDEDPYAITDDFFEESNAMLNTIQKIQKDDSIPILKKTDMLVRQLNADKKVNHLNRLRNAEKRPKETAWRKQDMIGSVKRAFAKWQEYNRPDLFFALLEKIHSKILNGKWELELSGSSTFELRNMEFELTGMIEFLNSLTPVRQKTSDRIKVFINLWTPKLALITKELTLKKENQGGGNEVTDSPHPVPSDEREEDDEEELFSEPKESTDAEEELFSEPDGEEEEDEEDEEDDEEEEDSDFGVVYNTSEIIEDTRHVFNKIFENRMNKYYGKRGEDDTEFHDYLAMKKAKYLYDALTIPSMLSVSLSKKEQSRDGVIFPSGVLEAKGIHELYNALKTELSKGITALKEKLGDYSVPAEYRFFADEDLTKFQKYISVKMDNKNRILRKYGPQNK